MRDGELLGVVVRSGTAGVAEISAEAGVDRAVVERWLARAEQDGWVVRDGDGFVVTAQGWAQGMAPGCGG